MEIQVVQILNHFGGPGVDKFSEYISSVPLVTALWVVIALAVLMFNKQQGKLIFITLLVALALHFIISEGLIKHDLLNLFDIKIRPYLAHPDIISPIGKQYIDSSFPSSHMASTLAMLTVLTYYYRKIWWVALLFALAMAFSRMHNGMHYPTDVLVGTILGLFYGFAAISITNGFRKKRSR